MDLSRLGLRLLQGAGLSLAAIVAICGLLFLRGPWCWNCRGKGGVVERECRGICPDCSGSGQGRQLHVRLYRIVGEPWRLAVVVNGENLWEGDPVALPGLIWSGAGVVVFLGLVVGLKGGVCPLCAGE